MEDNNKKSLIIKQPIITTNPYITNRIAVLLNYDVTLPWIYSNFINLWIGKDYPKNYWSDFIYFSAYRFCPFLHEYIIKKSIINNKWKNIVDFIIDIINDNGYLYLNINKLYIKEYNCTDNTMHDIFVYGYDNEHKTLCVADFFVNQKYSFIKVNYDDFIKAYENLSQTNQEDFINGVSTIYFKNANFNFDLRFIYNCFNDYLLSRNTTIATILEEFDNKEVISYGISSYQELIGYLDNIKERNLKLIDIRPFHLIYEHKVLMLYRLGFLKDHKILRDGGKINDLYESIKKDCLILRNRILKFNVSEDIELINQSISSLKRIYDDDKNALTSLLDSIKF